jgi:hypothetical protein
MKIACPWAERSVVNCLRWGRRCGRDRGVAGVGAMAGRRGYGFGSAVERGRHADTWAGASTRDAAVLTSGFFMVTSCGVPVVGPTGQQEERSSHDFPGSPPE